jgi:hypothetical protein
MLGSPLKLLINIPLRAQYILTDAEMDVNLFFRRNLKREKVRLVIGAAEYPFLDFSYIQ